MQKLITSSFLLAANLCAAQEVGSLSECLSGEDALIEDISTLQWPHAYSFKIDLGDSCYYTTFHDSYAWWHSSQEIQVRTQIYEHPTGSLDECQPGESNITYNKGTILYTSQSAWPYTEEETCAHVYVFTNLSSDEESTVELYTNGSIMLQASAFVLALGALLTF